MAKCQLRRGEGEGHLAESFVCRGVPRGAAAPHRRGGRKAEGRRGWVGGLEALRGRGAGRARGCGRACALVRGRKGGAVGTRRRRGALHNRCKGGRGGLGAPPWAGARRRGPARLLARAGAARAARGGGAGPGGRREGLGVAPRGPEVLLMWALRGHTEVFRVPAGGQVIANCIEGVGGMYTLGGALGGGLPEPAPRPDRARGPPARPRAPRAPPPRAAQRAQRARRQARRAARCPRGRPPLLLLLPPPLPLAARRRAGEAGRSAAVLAQEGDGGPGQQRERRPRGVAHEQVLPLAAGGEAVVSQHLGAADARAAAAVGKKWRGGGGGGVEAEAGG
jgi:hypothetical protein